MPRKKNVLLVISDQHNASLLGCEAHPQVRTPNLDRFAAEGVRFTNAYTQNTICTPSRVSILSGQYCHNHGIYGLSGPAPLGLNNLFRHFRQNGYRTAGLGKLHLPNSPKNWVADDLDRFGDTYEMPDGTIGDSDFFRYLEKLGLREKEDSWHNPWNYGESTITLDARPSELPYEHTQEVWCAREAMKFIDAAPDDPFFIKVSFQKPHHPLLPNEKFWNLYPDDLGLPPTCHLEPAHRPATFRKQWRNYHETKWDYTDLGDRWEDGARRQWRGTLACISQIDDVFGQLLDFLEQRGLADDTVVVYGADHGAYHGIHGIAEKAPGINSQAVCRVPMIWRVPGVTRTGMTNTQLIENTDIAPTLVSLCGLPPMDSVDGLDASELLSSDRVPLHEVAVTENPFNKALRWGKWRFVHQQSDVSPEDDDVGELYDMENDPLETRNLYGDPAYRDVVTACRRLLLEWLIRTTRVTTTHPAVKIRDDSQQDYRCGGTIRSTYPVAGDGRAPNDIQPRFREDLAENYI
ncbi:MAG: sulfatase-like hydrolase/transferase [Candidatus Pacebacteria bacterium]|nr:sulfatase-like hydrolase/transferase [Candidatus Paceibacterota bacterium]